MFLSNKYTKCYYKIVDRALSRNRQSDVYYEKHHILPKSLGGSNDRSNLVYLSAKEHFICHLLLVKMTEGSARRSMWYAAYRMCHKDNEYIPGSRIYEILRQKMILANKERIGPNKGKTMSQEQKDKISKSGKGIPRGPMSQSHKDNLKQKRSQETKDKISKARTGVSTGPRTKKQKAIAGAIWRGKKMPTQTCEYCLKQFSLLNYKRWHGFNCKINPN